MNYSTPQIKDDFTGLDPVKDSPGLKEPSSYILISAHHCAPDMGSEHAVGWNLVSRLARRHKILLITQDNEFRAQIESAIADLNTDGCQIKVFFVRHGSLTDGRQNNLRIGYYLTYIVYQWRVYRLAQTLCQDYQIGVAHHLTIVGFREPGFLWNLGRPFVWGPVGGLVFTPRVLFGELSIKMRLFQEFRNWITWVQFHLSPRVYCAYKATQSDRGAFIAATQDIGRRFLRYFGGTYIWIPETGSVAPKIPDVQEIAPRQCHSKLKVLWVGGLLDIKPLGLLLRSIALVPDYRHRIDLTIVGDGGSRERFELLASDLGIEAHFVGWVSHREIPGYFHNADLFVLLSMKDLTTNVVFESLGNGLPILCLDHHGYSNIVNESCGIKIPLTELKEMQHFIADTLDHLTRDRKQLAKLAKGAQTRAQEFTWDRNAECISEIYLRLDTKATG